MTDSSARPSLPTALAVVARAAAAGVRVAVAAEVLAYDRTDQTVRVRPKVADPALDANGLPVWEEAPEVGGVPVAWLRAGTVTLTAGVEVGDVGLLIYRDRSHDEVDSDVGETQVSPASHRRFNAADVVYLPASIVPAAPIPSSGHAADGSPVLAMGGALALLVGDSTADKELGRADRILSELQDIATTLGSIAGATFATPYTAPILPSALSSNRIKVDS